MLLKRKEAKKYGTKKVMEGHFKQGQKIVIVDDVLMTGASLVEDIKVRLINHRGKELKTLASSC